MPYLVQYWPGLASYNELASLSLFPDLRPPQSCTVLEHMGSARAGLSRSTMPYTWLPESLPSRKQGLNDAGLGMVTSLFESSLG